MPSTLVAYVLKNVGCMVGMRGMGLERKYKYKPYFLFRRENQPVNFGGKRGSLAYFIFSQGPAFLMILNKKRMLFFMHNFLHQIGIGLWSDCLEP